ncbi:MAG: hypothetical protein LBD29_01150 [Treponema sp.]|jgi:hypothetical protein|nr:hypothetical protein [Treponema sp.]
MMDTALVQAQAVKAMADRIAHEAPSLMDLSSEQLEQIARLVITQKLTKELSSAAHIAGIDYTTERSLFIETAGKTNSKHTRRGYTEALTRLEQFTDTLHIAVLELSPAQAATLC